MNPSTSSPEQIEANRVNARRSTGPATDEGKARSSQNARIHGLCSRQIHCADAGEEAVFSSLRTALTGEVRPAGELELILFETILHAQWNLRRCRMNEANLPGAAPNSFLDPETRAALKTLGIYALRHERSFQRAWKELRALQNERAARTNFAGGDEAEPSPLVETCRVRCTLLAEIGAKAALNKIGFEAAIQQIEKGRPNAPISYFNLTLPRAQAPRRRLEPISWKLRGESLSLASADRVASCPPGTAPFCRHLFDVRWRQPRRCREPDSLRLVY